MRIRFLTLLLTLAIVMCGSVVAQQPGDEEKVPFTIKLDPIADINPVKTQHTMIATVLDNQGRPLAGQRVDWILSRGPQMVGDIVEHDDMGAVVDTTNAVVNKIDNHYSTSYTNEGPRTLTMGTESTTDDIALGVGQTWLTITSPVEGETHIIAFCPGIKNSTRHKAFAVKYWVDAKITWPEDAFNRVGEQHTFKFNLIKASSSAPLSGYLVRWTLLEDEKAPKARLGTEKGNKVIESETDEEGNASVTLDQEETRDGMNKVQVELRKPTGELLAVRIVTKHWRAPRIEIVKKGPAEGILGEYVGFNIEVANPGQADAQEVVVKDKIEEGFEYIQCTLEPDSVKAGEIEWKLGTLPKDATKKFTLTLKAKKVGELQNTAVVLSKEAPPQTATAIVKIGAPEVYIIKQGLKEVRQGEVANYELAVKNSGDAVAKDVMIRDTIPAGLQFKDRDPNTPYTLKWQLGDLQPKEERKITYALNAVTVGSHTNTAKAYVKNKEVHKANFTTTVVAPEVKLTKSGPRLMYLHRSASYVIKIENNGNGPALDLVVTDSLPEHLDFIAAEPRGILKPAKDNVLASITWKFDQIPAKSAMEIKLELRAKKRGQCVNSVKLISTSDRPPKIAPMSAEVSTKIIGVPAMHVSTYDTEDPVEIGKQTIYVIDCRNEGTSPCTNILMRNAIPPEMEFIEAEGSTSHKWDEAGHQVIFEAFPILQPGDKLTFKIRCKAIKSGSAKNRAIMKYDQFDQEIINEEGTSVYQ